MEIEKHTTTGFQWNGESLEEVGEALEEMDCRYLYNPRLHPDGTGGTYLVLEPTEDICPSLATHYLHIEEHFIFKKTVKRIKCSSDEHFIFNKGSMDFYTLSKETAKKYYGN